MGSAIITPCPSNIRLGTVTKSHLERVLKSDRTTSALLNYLDRNNKGYLLKLYLDIFQYRHINKVIVLQKALQDIRSSLSPISSDESAKTTLLQKQTYDLITEIILAQTITNTSLKKLEDFCVICLSEELPSFFNSYEFSIRFTIDDGNFESKFGAVSKELTTIYKNVLIIDDSPRNSRLMSHYLKANGHSVRQANHGWIGTHIASINHFDVILIDLSMNTMDPYDVIKRLKANIAKYSSTLFIGLNYSEYDLKNHDNTLFSINMGRLNSIPNDFMTGVYKAILQFEEISCDNLETCNTCSTSNSSLSS